MPCVLTPQGKRDGSTKDEPFAWDARELLRKKAIGKVGRCEFVCFHPGPPPDGLSSPTCRTPVAACSEFRQSGSRLYHMLAWLPSCTLQPATFKVDFTIEQAGNKEFGTVFVGSENLAEVMVAAGLAKVRDGVQTS